MGKSVWGSNSNFRIYSCRNERYVREKNGEVDFHESVEVQIYCTRCFIWYDVSMDSPIVRKL